MATIATVDADPTLPLVGAVVLTQGRRPAELTAALSSLLAQQGVRLDVVVVGNGWAPVGLPDGVQHTVALPENLGIPAGRNAGVDAVAGDLLLFLDDDAALPDPGFLREVTRRFAADPTLGMVQPRVDVAGEGEPPRRWTPRARVGDRTQSSDVLSVWEGVVVVRREAFEAAGRWPDPFFYAHEGIELTWRVWDAGWRVRYLGDLPVHHPLTSPARHADHLRLDARNRVWLARRNLPWPAAVVYLAFRGSLQVARLARTPGALVTWSRGWVEGWRRDCGPRRPLHYRTLVRMAGATRAAALLPAGR
jgi:GT2 family glycosyltransferase